MKRFCPWMENVRRVIRTQKGEEEEEEEGAAGGEVTVRGEFSRRPNPQVLLWITSLRLICQMMMSVNLQLISSIHLLINRMI